MPGWGGPHWTEPEEAKAAAEAAEKFEKNRAAADARTQAICDAIRDGFSMLVDALLDPVGMSGLDRIYTGPLEDVSDMLTDPFDGDEETTELIRDPDGHE